MAVLALPRTHEEAKQRFSLSFPAKSASPLAYMIFCPTSMGFDTHETPWSEFADGNQVRGRGQSNTRPLKYRSSNVHFHPSYIVRSAGKLLYREDVEDEFR